MSDPTIYSGDGWEIRAGRWQDSAPESVDVVISDPPYSEHVHEKQWIASALTTDGAPRVSTAHSGLGFKHITQQEREQLCWMGPQNVNRWMLMFCDLESVGAWRAAVDGAGLDYVRACTWDKVDGAPQFSGDRPGAGAEAIICAHPAGRKRWNGGGRRGTFRHAVNGVRGAKPHPSTKPLALMLELVELFSEPGELVWDPYCGSGTTGVACLRLGRRFLGHEMQPHYAEIAAERLAAESRGLTLRDARRGQTSIFDAMGDGA